MTALLTEVSPLLDAKLRRLRRSVRVWHTVAGLRHLLTWLVLLIPLDLALDWLVRMDRPQRVICGAIAIAALAAVSYRRLLRPLAAPMAEDALVLRVEHRHRQIGQSLISAVQFARRRRAGQPEHASEALIDSTIAQGGRAAETANFQNVLDFASFLRTLAVVLALGAVLAAVGVSVAMTEPMSIWFDRNVLLTDRQWPQDTQLLIEGAADGRLTIPRGDDHQLVVRAEGVVPELVKLEYAPRSGASATMPMAQHGESEFRLTLKNVIEPFRLRARGGDAVTPWIEADLVERPAVEEFRLELVPPAYTGTSPEVVWELRTRQFDAADSESAGAAGSRGSSAVYALKGSSLSITARSNKELSLATVRTKGWAIPAAIDSSDPTRFRASVAPPQLAAGTYDIDLADCSGPPPLLSRQPTRFTVRIRPDRAPTVQAKLLGISGMVVPQAVIPIEMSLEDDFAVTRARLSGDWRLQEETRARSDRFTAPLDVIRGRGQAKVRHTHRLELGPLKLPIGADLSFVVEADDNDTVSGPKTGKSTVFYVKVVQEQDLRAELLRREQEQRQDFERLIHGQEELESQARGLGAETAQAAKWTPDQRKQVADLQRRQHGIATRCEAIARQFEAIEAEVHNNRLEESDGAVQRRLRGKIIGPLDVLAAKQVPVVTASLESAARSSADKAARNKALDAAVAGQKGVAAAMREILKHMVKWEGYQEAVNLALEVLKAQQDVNESTARAIRKRLESIFGTPDTAPAKPKP